MRLSGACACASGVASRRHRAATASIVEGGNEVDVDDDVCAVLYKLPQLTLFTELRNSPEHRHRGAPLA